MQKMLITAGFWADLIFRQTRTDLVVPIFTPTRWFLVVFLPALFENLSEAWLLVLLERILISRYQHLIPGCRISLTGQSFGQSRISSSQESGTADGSAAKRPVEQSCATWRVISTSGKLSELDFALPTKHITIFIRFPVLSNRTGICRCCWISSSNLPNPNSNWLSGNKKSECSHPP